MIFYFREYFPLKLLVDLDNRGEGDSVNRPRLIPDAEKRDQCLSCPFSIGNPPQIALRLQFVYQLFALD